MVLVFIQAKQLRSLWSGLDCTLLQARWEAMTNDHPVWLYFQAATGVVHVMAPAVHVPAFKVIVVLQTVVLPVLTGRAANLLLFHRRCFLNINMQNCFGCFLFTFSFTSAAIRVRVGWSSQNTLQRPTIIPSLVTVVKEFFPETLN